MSRSESRPTIPVAPDPGVPERAPECARHVAWALDRLLGGDGRWALDLEDGEES